MPTILDDFWILRQNGPQKMTTQQKIKNLGRVIPHEYCQAFIYTYLFVLGHLQLCERRGGGMHPLHCISSIFYYLKGKNHDKQITADGHEGTLGSRTSGNNASG